VGRWKGQARDFGLIWGRHVYLCSFDDKRYWAKNDKEHAPKYSLGFINRPGQLFDSQKCNRQRDKELDFKFFSGFKGDYSIRVQAHSCAGGNDKEYNWDNLYVIIPDLHLMSWQVANNWYSFNHPKSFHLDAEIALMHFAENIIRIGNAIGREKIKVIQIGDSYELWIGLGRNANPVKEYFYFDGKHYDRKCPYHIITPTENVLPLFKYNKDELMVIDKYFTHFDNQNGVPNTEPTRNYLTKEIKKIQTISDEELKICNKDELLKNDSFYQSNKREIKGVIRGREYLNPAEVALRSLENTFKDSMIYIYGNHDNYLIDLELQSMAGLKSREAFIEDKALFVEHAHRMEANFLPLVPRNHDGCYSGFMAANQLYCDICNKKKISEWVIETADWWGEASDQEAYLHEFAKFWMGRKSNKKNTPRIFVIGHTHRPAIYKFNICFDKPNQYSKPTSRTHTIL
jgi:predicted phosphodiesterase